MAGKVKKTTSSVCIVESLEFLQESSHREGEIVARTLRLSEKTSHYTYLRTRLEFEAFLEEFGNSSHRYLHISCHGNDGAFYTTTDEISALELAALLAPYAKRRRIFLSACLAAESPFARALLKNSDCWSVLAPVGTINFDDAAIFWTAFYHLMFKQNPESMTRKAIEETVTKCAELVRERFRLFYKEGGVVKSKTIGPVLD